MTSRGLLSKGKRGGSKSSLQSKMSQIHGDVLLKSALNVYCGSTAKLKWKPFLCELYDKVLLVFSKSKGGKMKPRYTLELSGSILKAGEGLCGERNTIALIGVRKDPFFLKPMSDQECARWMAALAPMCASTEWSAGSMSAGFVDPVVIADSQVKIIEVNDAFLQLFGYTRDNIIGKSVELLMPKATAANHEGYVARYHETGEKHLIGKPRRMIGIHSNGSEIPVIVSLGVEGSGDDTIFLGMIRLDKDRKHKEASQAEIEQMLQATIDKTLEDTRATLHEQMSEQLSTLMSQLNDAKAAKKLISARNLGRSERSEMATDSSDNSLETTADDTSLAIDTTRVVMGPKLGGGGSGAIVYSCNVDGWQCAVKELPLAGVKQSTIDNCLAELVLLESLPKHKNLVQFLFHERTAECIRIFMTRYEQTLSSVLRKRQANDEYFKRGTVVRMVFDVVRALDILHDFKVIHRDLKSGNLFVNFDQVGGISHLTLSDFDSAKVVADDEQAKTIIGTIGWMPPEIYGGGGKAYSFSADIWALGAVFFELMDLGEPFSNIDDFDRPSHISSGELPAFRNPNKVESLFGPLLPCWKSMMVVDPEKRPSLKEIRSQLSDHM